MSELFKNNRVVVTHGEHRGQHGKVLDDTTRLHLQTWMKTWL
jgi:ribosomal protein L24